MEPVKDLANYLLMVCNVFFIGFPFSGSSVYCYVIHIDGNTSSVDKVSEYSVHHGLKGCRGVSESEEHHSQFKESFVSYEGHFPPIFFFDEYLIVPPLNVDSHEQHAAS